jgi:hypothetical protein
MPNNLSLSTHIEWHNNLPRVVGREVLSKQVITDLHPAVLTLDYVPRRSEDTGEILPGEEEFIGKMNIEVAMIRAARDCAYGDYDKLEKMLDRILGKPKQSVETKSMTMTYQDYLDSLPEPSKDDEVEIEALLSLNPEDASQAYSLQLRKAQFAELADDL